MMENITDLTFVTSEKNQTLLDHFKVLIKNTELFDRATPKPTTEIQNKIAEALSVSVGDLIK